MEQEPGRQQAEHQPDHAQHEVRDRLAEQDLVGAHRRDEQGFKRAAFPLARHHQGGQQGADQRHDQHDQAGHQEVVAVVGLVEPEPALHDHRRRAGSGLALGRAARRPLADRPLRVALDDPGAVGVGAVDDDLHLGVAQGQAPREVGADADDAVDLVAPASAAAASAIERQRCGRRNRARAGSWRPARCASGDGSSSTTATGTFFTSSDRP